MGGLSEALGGKLGEQVSGGGRVGAGALQPWAIWGTAKHGRQVPHLTVREGSIRTAAHSQALALARSRLAVPRAKNTSSPPPGEHNSSFLLIPCPPLSSSRERLFSFVLPLPCDTPPDPLPSIGRLILVLPPPQCLPLDRLWAMLPGAVPLLALPRASAAWLLSPTVLWTAR